MFDVNHLVQTGGLLLISIIIFAESGMMVGFFFPGDTLLFAAGILAATGQLSIVAAIVCISLAAILGDNIGYLIGRKLGPRLFKKDSVVFRKEYIAQAERFYEKYGTKTMLVAHFVPIIRTFAPVTAGAGHMDRKQFFVYDAIGDIAWAVVVTLAGYFIGSRIPGIEKFIEPVILLIVLAVLVPTIIHAARDPKIRAALKAKLKKR
ncbi:VTT domain-containing protein [Aeromicrobium sp.]|nr:VTT domain-containing protein [Candidatus Saccharibacteria bacterium]